MAYPEDKGLMPDLGEEGHMLDRMEVDEAAIRMKKRANKDVSGGKFKFNS